MYQSLNLVYRSMVQFDSFFIINHFFGAIWSHAVTSTTESCVFLMQRWLQR